MNRMKRWRCGVVLLALLGILCIGSAAVAYDAVDPGQSATLTVYFGTGEAGFSNVTFQIYRVAEVSEQGQYTLTGAFAAYSVHLSDLDSSGWRALAQTLDAYAARDGLEPQTADQTGSDGRVSFAELETGLYLVTGGQIQAEGRLYTPEALLVSLPGLTEEGDWDYAPEIDCKYDSVPLDQELVSRRVLKVWDDHDDTSARPSEITVQLLRDGTVADTVTLSRANNWTYTWGELDAASKWQVAEAGTPEGYTVSVAQEGITFVMTNTYRTTITPSVPPTIPQTGTLWWVVPLLGGGGLILLAVGCLLRRSGIRDEE